MPYLVSLLVVVAAAVALLVLLARLGTTTRRLAGTARLCQAYLTDHAGLLRARIAGLQAELRRRRHREPVAGSADPRPRSI